VNRQKKVERKERGHDKIILPPSGISRQWPFPALTNSLRDSTETISTIAHTQLRPSGVLSCTRISSTDFLLFPSSPPPLSLSLSLSLPILRARALSPPPSPSSGGVNSPVTHALPLLVDVATTPKKEKKSSRARALHATLPHTMRAPSSLCQHVYRISALPPCRLHHAASALHGANLVIYALP